MAREQRGKKKKKGAIYNAHVNIHENGFLNATTPLLCLVSINLCQGENELEKIYFIPQHPSAFEQLRRPAVQLCWNAVLEA